MVNSEGEVTPLKAECVTTNAESVRVKRLAYLAGLLSLVIAVGIAIPVGILISIPFRGVGGQYMGRPFFGTLFGVPIGIILFVVGINIIGQALKVRKEAVAILVTPPARFMISKGKKTNTTLLIVTMAMMLAIGVVLNIVAFSLPGFGGVASFVYSFMYLCGILFGPLFGFAVAFLADLFGYMLAPAGVYSPFIGISNGVTAMIVALVFKLRFSNKFYKDTLLIVFVLICMVTIMSAYYFNPYYSGGTRLYGYSDQYPYAKEFIGYSRGGGLHNGARVVIIATVATLLIFGLYKIISIKTHGEDGKERPQWFVKLLLGAIIAFVPATLVLSTYGVYTLGIMQGNFMMVMMARLISQPVWVGINLFLLYMIIPTLNRTVFKGYPIE